MKKIHYSLFTLCFCVMSTFFLSSDNAFCEDDYVPMKAAFIDVGYGWNNLGLGFGGRYSNFGASIGIAGIGTDMPAYSKTEVLTAANTYTKKSYTSTIITLDAYYFYDINDKYTAFANVGYSMGTDSLFGTKMNETDGTLYRLSPTTESKNAFTFGAGFQYFLEEYLGFGIGIHSKRGIYAQINYFWF